LSHITSEGGIASNPIVIVDSNEHLDAEVIESDDSNSLDEITGQNPSSGEEILISTENSDISVDDVEESAETDINDGIATDEAGILSKDVEEEQNNFIRIETEENNINLIENELAEERNGVLDDGNSIL
jgi:hypothetical protein